MTLRYVGPGGSDVANGLTWATRKLTLAGVEATPVAAGDTVYVGPGTYRETLTVGVSGTVGAGVITYIGDYLGKNTDGVGGLVRITGSDNDQVSARNNVLFCSAKNYRTFSGFLIDGGATNLCAFTNAVGFIIDKCVVGFGTGSSVAAIRFDSVNQSACTVQNSVILQMGGNNIGIWFTHSATLSNIGHLVQNCLIFGCRSSIQNTRVGGNTVKNSTLLGGARGVYIDIALAGGQTLAVNNCLLSNYATAALVGTATTEIIEDYNNLLLNFADRTNTNTGAHSNAFIPYWDARLFMQVLFAGAGPSSPLQMITPFDLASFCALIDVAGTSPTTTDLRGTAAINSVREWGALEYDATLKIKNASGVAISPMRGSFT